MKWIISRYCHKVAYLKDYTDDYVMYDRSPEPLPNTIIVPNIGSDLYDKFTYIIDNYDNLPDVAVYTKANLFDYIKPKEFEKIKDNTTFTPILSQDHNTYNYEGVPICYYKDGIYYEINNYFYLNSHPAKYFKEIKKIFEMDKREYNAFCPGSGYILTKEDIQRHSKEFYIKLRSFLDWTVYPGDAQLLERNLYYLWGTDIIRAWDDQKDKLHGIKELKD